MHAKVLDFVHYESHWEWRSEEIVLVAKTGSKIHFDVAQLRIMFYDSAIDLQRKLAPRLDRMIAER